MSLAQGAIWLAAAALKVGARRALRGPKRAGWTWTAETLACFIQDLFRRTEALPLPALRGYFEASAVPSLPFVGVPRRPVSVDTVPGEWFEPPDATPGAALLYFHGGGYIFGSTSTHADLIARLSRAAQLRVLAINYRLAPEHPFPAALKDCLRAYHWLLERGIPPRRLVVAGESAGGGLTLATLLELRDAGQPLPAAAVAISPWVDHTLTHASVDENARFDFTHRGEAERYSAAYRAGVDRRDPRVSPLFAELAGLPPLLLQVGTAEVLRDEVCDFAERARAAGVAVTLQTWPDMFHIWHFGAPVLPQGREAIAQAGRFAHQHLGWWGHSPGALCYTRPE